MFEALLDIGFGFVRQSGYSRNLQKLGESLVTEEGEIILARTQILIPGHVRVDVKIADLRCSTIEIQLPEQYEHYGRDRRAMKTYRGEE